MFSCSRGRRLGKCLFARTPRFAGSSVDEVFCVGVVGSRRKRRTHDGAEDGIKVVGQLVTTGVNVDRRGKGLDVKGFLDAPTNPILLGAKNGDVFFAEVVTVVSCMLKHG